MGKSAATCARRCKALKRLENSSAPAPSSDTFKAGGLKTLRCVWLVGSTLPKP